MRSAKRSRGRAPLAAYRAASCGAARAFGLSDRGQIAPGRRADIVLLDDLESCAVAQVICGGAVVDAAAFAEARRRPGRPWLGQAAAGRARGVRRARRRAFGPVIGAIENSLLTEHLTLELPYQDGLRLPDPAQGVHKLCVLERHGRGGTIGRGFVRGSARWPARSPARSATTAI